MCFTTEYDSPLGRITIASNGKEITGLWFEGQKYFSDGVIQPVFTAAEKLPVFRETEEWLDLYFSGTDPGFIPPLRPCGTPFRLAVWTLLLRIPYGETVSYRELADELRKEYSMGGGSARAVGSAVGRNRISLLIPCHRVIGSDGSLTGYAGGIGRKKCLLDLEHGIEIIS